MLKTIVTLAAVALAAQGAQAATFTAIETNTRNDTATGRLALPTGVTEASADLALPRFTPGVPEDMNAALTGGAAFGLGDSLSVFGGMTGFDDNLLVRFDTAFTITVDALSDVSAANDPIWRLFSGDTLGGTPLFTEVLPEVTRGAGQGLFGVLAAGTYILQIDGDDAVQNTNQANTEAYDVTFAAMAVPLPAGFGLLLASLGGLALLRRRP